MFKGAETATPYAAQPPKLRDRLRKALRARYCECLMQKPYIFPLGA